MRNIHINQIKWLKIPPVQIALFSSVILASTLYQIDPTSAKNQLPKITNFSQSESILTVTLNVPVDDYKISFLPKVPLKMDLQKVLSFSQLTTVNGRVLKIPLKNEIDSSEYSVVVFIEKGWFELVRQSSTWLRTKFGFERPGGYTILGRRSIEVAGDAITTISPLEFIGRPHLSKIKPTGTSIYPEVGYARAILELLWSQPLKQGPNSKSYGVFLELPFRDKLVQIRNGKFSLMCQGMRDLFLHASEGISGFKARAVEALNYGQAIPNLINYGHSTAEIWIEKLGKWVLFDPWLGIMIVDGNSMPLGALDIQRMGGKITRATGWPH